MVHDAKQTFKRSFKRLNKVIGNKEDVTCVGKDVGGMEDVEDVELVDEVEEIVDDRDGRGIQN